MLRRVLPGIALLLAVACGGATSTLDSCDVPPPSVTFGAGRSLEVTVASTDEDRARGLMGVSELAPDQGMAFVFGASASGTFWMKDTLIPLAIAFVGEDGRINTIREMTPCPAEPCLEYGAAARYTMAIEANAGWFAEHGVGIGDRVRLRQAACA